MRLSLLPSLLALLLAGLMIQVGAKKGGGRRAVFRTELSKNLREDFTITEKAPSRASPTGSFTFKTLLRHYDKRVLTHGK